MVADNYRAAKRVFEPGRKGSGDVGILRVLGFNIMLIRRMRRSRLHHALERLSDAMRNVEEEVAALEADSDPHDGAGGSVLRGRDAATISKRTAQLDRQEP